MEFEDEHDEELEEEEDDDEEITIPPPSVPPSYDTVGATTAPAANTNSATHRPPRLNTNVINHPSLERRSGVIRYRECLKNHAVNIGGHAVDGCCEFMAAGEEGTLDALKCAACNCHRNFHRKEIDPTVGGDSNAPPPATPTQIHAPTSGGTALYPPFTGYYRTPPGVPPSGYLHVSAPPHRPLAVVPTTSGGTHSGGDMADDMSLPSSSGGGTVIMREGGSGGGSSKKRHRTKFSQDQKDKMLAFAEKLGWRIQKHDEAAVQQFCAEIQVKRQVLKVWMHNNKHTLGKKP